MTDAASASTMPALLMGPDSPIILLSIKNPHGIEKAVGNAAGFVYESSGRWHLVATARHFVRGHDGSLGMAAADIAGRPCAVRGIIEDPLPGSDVAFLLARTPGTPAVLAVPDREPTAMTRYARLHAVRCVVSPSRLEPAFWSAEDVPVSRWLVYKKQGTQGTGLVERTDTDETQRLASEGWIRHEALPVELEHGFSGSPLVDEQLGCLGMVIGGIPRLPQNDELLRAYGDLTWYVPPRELARARERIAHRFVFPPS